MTKQYHTPKPPYNLDQLKQWKASEYWGRTNGEDYIDLAGWDDD